MEAYHHSVNPTCSAAKESSVHPRWTCKSPMPLSEYIIDRHARAWPYECIASGDTRPFSKAPDVLLASLGRLTWAMEPTVGSEEFQRPNELLALGYFEKMSIGGCKLFYSKPHRLGQRPSFSQSDMFNDAEIRSAATTSPGSCSPCGAANSLAAVMVLDVE
jgi:hypothetical protein